MIVNGVSYIPLPVVIEIHAREISARGGATGIRNQDALQSALGQPMAGWGAEEFYPTIFDKASVYAYHIAESQPFVDGNKRTAHRTALTFLAINGYALESDDPRLYEAMISIGTKEMKREDLSRLYEQLWAEQNNSK